MDFNASVLLCCKQALEAQVLQKEAHFEPFGQQRGIFITLYDYEGKEKMSLGFYHTKLDLKDAILKIVYKLAQVVSKDELQGISYRIDLVKNLTKMEQISTIDTTRHGLIVESHGFLGVVLPFIIHHKPVQEALEMVYTKAGLLVESQEVTIYTFETDVIL